MEYYLESVLERYVIATLDIPTRYLVFKDDKISFTNYISKGTKTAGRKTAERIRDDFYSYTGMTDIELVVLPIRISYEIVQEEKAMVEGECCEMLS